MTKYTNQIILIKKRWLKNHIQKGNQIFFQDKKLAQVCDFLRTDRDINDETRNKFAFLNMSTRKRKSKSNKFLEEKYGNDINSTGSFLSDLSVTQSEEDFLEVSKPFKKHRPSATGVNGSFAENANKRRSARMSIGERRSKSMFYPICTYTNSK